MARLPIASWIGNAAAVWVGGWGAVSRRARAIGCSRQAVYDHAAKVEQAVTDAAGGGASRADFREQVRQQRLQIAELQRRLSEAIEFPETQQQRFAATATAMGLSYSQTRELLEVVAKKCPSGSKIARWVKASAVAAGRVLKGLDEVSRRLVKIGCFDEIFFHGKPVLVGVEPHSMAWVLGQQAADRSGRTWSQALEGFEELEQAVVDGGEGVEAGRAVHGAVRPHGAGVEAYRDDLGVVSAGRSAE